MACIKPDGTLTSRARRMLEQLRTPLTPQELSSRVEEPLFKVRSILRELENAELVTRDGEKSRATSAGLEKIET